MVPAEDVPEPPGMSQVPSWQEQVPEEVLPGPNQSPAPAPQPDLTDFLLAQPAIQGEPGKIESAYRSGTDALSLGLADTARAAGAAVLPESMRSEQESQAVAPRPNDLEDTLGARFSRARRANLERTDRAAAANPKSAISGQAAALLLGLRSMRAPSPGTQVAKVRTLGQTLRGLPATMAAGGAAGAGAGAIYGAARSPTLADVPERAGTGAAWGLAAGAGLPVAGAALRHTVGQPLGSWLRGVAERDALKAMGGPGTAGKLARRAGTTGRLTELSGELLDEGINMKAPPEAIAKEVIGRTQAYGAELSKLTAEAESRGARVNLGAVTKDALAGLPTTLTKDPSALPYLRRVLTKLQQSAVLRGTWTGDKRQLLELTPREAHELRMNMDNIIYGATGDKAPTGLAQALQQAFRGPLDRHIGQAMEGVGLRQPWAPLNAKLHNLYDAGNILLEGIGAEGTQMAGIPQNMAQLRIFGTSITPSLRFGMGRSTASLGSSGNRWNNAAGYVLGREARPNLAAPPSLAGQPPPPPPPGPQGQPPGPQGQPPGPPPRPPEAPLPPLPEPVRVSPREFALREGVDPETFETTFVGGGNVPNPENAAASVTGTKPAGPKAKGVGPGPDLTALRTAAIRGEQQSGATPAPRVMPPPSPPRPAPEPVPDANALQSDVRALRAQLRDEEAATRARLAEQASEPKPLGIRAQYKDIEDYLTPAQLRELGLRGGKAAKKPTKKRKD
jgi:hypothetical protein